MRRQIQGSILLLSILLALTACAENAAFEGGKGTRANNTSENGGDQEGEPVAQPTPESSSPESSSPDDTISMRVPSNLSLQKLFDTSMKADQTAQFTLGDGYVRQDIALKNVTEPVELSFNQVDRLDYVNTFEQGPPAAVKIDEFMQTASAQGILDLLIVVDDSGSMSEEQKNLSTKLSPLLESVKDSDWQIAVITTTANTDPVKNCLRGLIKKGDINAVTAFATAVSPGISGSGNEQGIFQAVAGLKGCNGSTWVRPKSTVAVLVVTDENNCSNGTCSTNPAASDSAYLTNHLKDTMGRVLGDEARVYGLIKMSGDATCTSAPTVGLDYEAAIAATKGKAGSICAADYTTTLKAISADIKEILKNQFELKYTPDGNGVVVKIQNKNETSWNTISSGFTISGKVLTFSDIPAAGSKIEVKYQISAGSIVSQFSLSHQPIVNSVKVYVDQNLIESSKYTVDAAQKLLMYTPPAGSKIKVLFTEDLPLDTRFAIGKDAAAASIKVTVDGAEEKGFSYDSASGDLVFASAPKEASAIVVRFDRNKGPQLEYPLAIVGSNAYDFKAFDKTTGAELAVSHADGKVTFQAGDHADGRMVQIRYKNDSSGKANFDLMQEPLAGSLVVKSSDEACALGAGVELNGKALVVDCDLGKEIKFDVAFQYRKEGEAPRSFSVDEVKDGDVGTWTVKVDGEVREDFTRSGNTISFAAPLAEDAKVLVIYNYQEFALR